MQHDPVIFSVYKQISLGNHCIPYCSWTEVVIIAPFTECSIMPSPPSRRLCAVVSLLFCPTTSNRCCKRTLLECYPAVLPYGCHEVSPITKALHATEACITYPLPFIIWFPASSGAEDLDCDTASLSALFTGLDAFEPLLLNIARYHDKGEKEWDKDKEETLQRS